MPEFLIQTRQFASAHGAAHFVQRLRGIFGHKAKCTIRSDAEHTYVRFKVPVTDKPIPDAGTVVTTTNIKRVGNI